jgi:acyl-CoA synthetase (AMP-forming)/AMP-acid ligase II
MSSVTSSFREQVEQHPDARAFVFLPDGEDHEEVWTYAGLDRDARGIAARLQARGARAGDRALLLFPPGGSYVGAFLGCLYAGVVAVPAYPPDPERLQRTLPRLKALADDARVRFVLTESWLRDGLEAQLELRPTEGPVQWLAVEAAAEDAEIWQPHTTKVDDVAFIQYTSGSTGDPRGVVLEHRHIMANIEVMVESWSGTSEDPVVSWLPPYHDMGLIGMILTPITEGAQAVAMSPVAFLQRPARWLQAMTRYRGAASAAPNFAYELCVRRIGESERSGIDLANWRMAINGAEPVRADTLRRFTEAFAPCGFSAEHMQICFGMAECTLLVTAGSYADPCCTLEVDAGTLREGIVSVASDRGQETTKSLCGGRAVKGTTVEIVDPETQRSVPDGRIGELWVRGPSVAAGYWGREAETASTFRARRLDDPQHEYLRTGDLGFALDGRVFVTGRLTDVLVIHGKNHYPQDIELTAEAADRRLRRGCGAAIGVEGAGGEGLALVHEFGAGELEADETMARVRAAILDEHGLAVCRLALVAPRTIPKTSSGKIRRRATRIALERGELAVIGEWASTATASGSR